MRTELREGFQNLLTLWTLHAARTAWLYDNQNADAELWAERDARTVRGEREFVLARDALAARCAAPASQLTDLLNEVLTHDRDA